MNIAALRDSGYSFETRNHAQAILERDFDAHLAELCGILTSFRISASELVRGGGGESTITQRLRTELEAAKWLKRQVRILKIVDGEERASQTHEIDHYRDTRLGAIGLEIEWNNKDPFFDRDLENFQRLHAEGALSVGVLITRGPDLQDRLEEIIRLEAERRDCRNWDDLFRVFEHLPTPKQRRRIDARLARSRARGASFLNVWAHAFVQSKFGAATTHWRKLLDRLDRGVGNPCPLLLIGLPARIVRDG